MTPGPSSRASPSRDDCVRGIRMSRNYGQHNALLCGIRAARYPIIVTLDDDLQNPPEEIHKLIAALDEGADVVYGTPENEQHGFLRDQSSRITKLALQGAMGAETARHVSAFRAFRTRLRDAFATYRGPYVSIDVLLTWGTTKFSHIPVRHEPRAMGASNYTVRKLVTHAFNMMTGLQHAATPDRQRHRLSLHVPGVPDPALRADQLPHERRGRPGLRLPRLDHRDLQRRPAVRAGDHRRVPGPDAFSLDGSPDLPGPGGDRRRMSPTARAARASRRHPRVLARAVGHGDLRVPGRADHRSSCADGAQTRRRRWTPSTAGAPSTTCAWSRAGWTIGSFGSRWPWRQLGFRFVEMVYRPSVRCGSTAIATPRHDIRLAEATPADVAGIEAIASSAFHDRAVPARRAPASGAEPTAATRPGCGQLRVDRQTVLKAELDGELVGFLIVEHRPDASVYWHLTAIAPEWQGQGIGTSVWQTMLSATGLRVRRPSRRRSPVTTCRSSTCMRGWASRSRRPR